MAGEDNLLGPNLARAKVSITGIKPLLWNHFSPELLPLTKKEKTGVAGNDPEEWKRTVLVNDKNTLYVEPEYIFGCLREGAKYTKQGRKSFQSIIAATLQVLDNKVLTDRVLPDNISSNPNQPVYLDIRSVKNPQTRGRNIRYRVAASPGWKIVFNIMWDITLINSTQMKSIIIDSGTYSGLGDGRGIGYGRFKVDDFEEVKNNA